ncbi:protein of unknown function [Moritella yayanosii]|uniref:Uncharacterized protein n=1 Tax=Moritella yayanosii TaxID=69539 RepID=A0A330LL38_9GAMM|nr:protein of unknown function [Moritella yayanosii]
MEASLFGIAKILCGVVSNATIINLTTWHERHFNHFASTDS